MATSVLFDYIDIIFILIGLIIFLVGYFAGAFAIVQIKKFRHNRLLKSTEYLPEEEVQTLKQVFYLIIMTICFVDILYTLIFWGADDFYRYFIFYDILASVIGSLAINRKTKLSKAAKLALIPFSSLFHMVDYPTLFVLIFLAIHFLGLAYVIKTYYSKFIKYTESNGLGISILLLFGLVFVSFIFTSFTEGKDLLDSLVMVSNAFTSNGYAVLGTTVIGKINSLFLVWGGYVLSGVGTATLTTALLSRHFNKKFDELENMIKNNNMDNDEKNEDNV